MKPLLLPLLLLYSFFLADADAQVLTPRSFPVPFFPHQIGYLEYLPPGYGESSETFPALIHLHGGGESGLGTPEELEKLKAWGPPRHISLGHNMCFNVDGNEECFIVFAPQAIDALNFVTVVSGLLKHILDGPDNYKIDKTRIYLAGLSRGGKGAYEYAASILNNPNQLAAIAPMSALMDSPDGCFISAKKIPVWAFHGTKDTIVPVALGRSAFGSIYYCDSPSPVAELIFTEYPDRYHDAWIPGYDPTHTFHDPNVYEWMLSKRLDTTNVITNVGELANKWELYPNPAQGEVYLTLNDIVPENATVSVHDLSGRLLLHKKYEGQRLTISELSKGIYMIQVTGNDGSRIIRRLVIQ